VPDLAVNDPNSLVSSSNQKVHVFNSDLENKLDWASNQIEVHIQKDGSRIITGFREF
jgi:anaerobic ribonucleoside-triphosphate reductase activating protein